jgi:hypothetical protein
MSKQNQKGMKPNFLKQMNFEIKKLQRKAVMEPCGFPHTNYGRKIYFENIQILKQRKEKFINQVN